MPATIARPAVRTTRAQRKAAAAKARRRAARRRAQAAAVGLVAGYLLDAALGDPRKFHPVAGYGKAATVLERRTYAPTRAAGAQHALIAVGAPVLGAAIASFATRRRPLARAMIVAATTWAVLGGRSLRREARELADALDARDLADARRRLPNLAGRDPSTLDESELARATVESVAENTSDAVVAPLFWGAIAGLPGLVGYRAVNTLDAMVGHRNVRYAQFGTVAARADDVANLVPSRLTAALVVGASPLVGGRPGRAAWVWFRDGHRHPSPNAGQCEAAMAGALDIRLGGTNVYFGQIEVRPQLGDGRAPSAADIHRAARLSSAVGAGALALATLRALTGPWRPWRRFGMGRR
jgi:adenosylcobinamide-phosphate synthase